MSAPGSGNRIFHMIEAVADRLEGAPRQLRRRWSDEFKAQDTTEAMKPGASVSAIARSAFTHHGCSHGVVMLGPSVIVAHDTRVAKQRRLRRAVPRRPQWTLLAVRRL